MITKQWYKWFGALLAGGTASFVDTSGVTRSNISPYYSSYSRFAEVAQIVNTNIDVDAGVCFGTGGTPPTFDDYKQAGDVITEIATTVNRVVENNDDGHTITATYTITNNNPDNITIAEICMVGNAFYKSSYAYRFLMDRTVLDSPVTIPAGGVGQITYTIRMNYPTA